MPQTEARTRSPKTATVERREASVLRYWTRRASQARQRDNAPVGAPLTPRVGGGRKVRTRARPRRGNAMGCLTSEDVTAALGERVKPSLGLMLRRPHALCVRPSRSRGRHGGAAPMLRNGRTTGHWLKYVCAIALLSVRAEQDGARDALFTGGAFARSCPRSSLPRRARQDSLPRGCRWAK